MNVDWSKAPEGATHYVAGCGFFKTDLAGWFVCDGDEKVWRKTLYKSPENFYWWGNAIQRPAAPQWNGEGLPPVGAVVEAVYMGSPQGVVTVRYAGQCMILWSDERNSEQCGAAEHYLFRPIRTPEQLAAEAREKAIIEIMRDAGITGSAFKDDPEALEWASSLWAKGYRKQEQPE